MNKLKLEAVNKTMDQLELQFFSGEGNKTEEDCKKYTRQFALLQELRESLYWDCMRDAGELK